VKIYFLSAETVIINTNYILFRYSYSSWSKKRF